MRFGTWLVGALAMTTAMPVEAGEPAEPYPGLPRYVVAPPVGRAGAWEVTPEELAAQGFPTYAAALETPGSPVPAGDSEEQQRFFAILRDHAFSVLHNGTFYGSASTHGDGPAGACCQQVSFEPQGRKDPAPWRTTPEALRADGFRFVARAIDKSGFSIAISERTDEALRFVKALRERGATHVEVAGQQYAVGFQQPSFPAPAPDDAPYAVLLQVVPAPTRVGPAWSTSPQALERDHLLTLAAALASPGRYFGVPECRGGACPELAAFNAALLQHNATHLRWNGTDHAVHYVESEVGGVPGGHSLRWLSQGAYVHASDRQGTYWGAPPEDLARSGMPTIARALREPGRFVASEGGWDAEVAAFKAALEGRNAVHLRHAGRLWGVTFASEWQVLAPAQGAASSGLHGPDGASQGPATTRLPTDDAHDAGPDRSDVDGGGPLRDRATPLPALLAVLALWLAAHRRR